MCPDEEFWEHQFNPVTLACEYCGEQVDVIVRTEVSCREPVHMAPVETEPLPA